MRARYGTTFLGNERISKQSNVMKNGLFLLSAAALLSACSGAANDGNPETDTSSFSRDTQVYHPADTAAHINIAGGRHTADSARGDSAY